MQKKSVKKSRAANMRVKNRTPNTSSQATNDAVRPAAAAGKQPAINTLKQNLTGKKKAIFEILDDVKKVKPDQWQDPNQIEQMAKNFANKLGLPVPEQRIKQFVSAYKDATKNGPNTSVDDLVKKYGKNVDDKTLNEIKKFVPKSK